MSRLSIALFLLLLLGPLKAQETEFVVRIRQRHFDPAELQVPAGVRVKIVLDNQDDVAEEFDSHSLNREKHVPAHGRVTLYLGPLEPGRYVYEGEERGGSGGPALGVVVAR
jgi:plastocyanin